MFNNDLIEQRPPRVFERASEAIQYALSAYWVDPIFLDVPEGATFGFDMEIRVADLAQNGQIHYERRTR